MIDKRELRLSIMTTMTIVRSNQPAIEQNNPLKIIDFTFGGIDLTLKGEEALRKIAQALKANPNNTIKFIPGYGPRGGKAQNERLALKRAKQVEGMLKNMGVSENQIVVLRKAQQFSVAAVGYTIKEPKAIPNTAISKNPSVVLNNNPSQTTGLQTTGSVFGLNYANKDIGYYGRAAWEVFANSWGEIPGELKKLLNPTTIMVLAAVGVATVVAPQVMLPALTAAGVGMNAIGALRIIGSVITAENDRDIRDAAEDFAAFITLPAVTMGLGKIASVSGLNKIIPVLNGQKVIKSLPGPIREFLTFMSSNLNNLGKMKNWISKNINISNLPKGWNFPNFGSKWPKGWNFPNKKTTVATAGNTNITPPPSQGQNAPDLTRTTNNNSLSQYIKYFFPQQNNLVPQFLTKRPGEQITFLELVLKEGNLSGFKKLPDSVYESIRNKGYTGNLSVYYETLFRDLWTKRGQLPKDVVPVLEQVMNKFKIPKQ